MYSRIDYESGCSPSFRSKPAIVGKKISVEPHLLAKPLCVESPPFDERRVATVASELWKIRKFLLDCDLEVMARDCFMIGEGRLHVLWLWLRLAGVEVEGSVPESVSWGCRVDRSRPV